MFATQVFLFFFALLLLRSCSALRCRTEDGPTVEEIKKVVRTCMNNNDMHGSGNNRDSYSNRQGNNNKENNNNNGEFSHSDQNNEDEYSDQDYENDSYRGHNNNHRNSHGGGKNGGRRNDDNNNNNDQNGSDYNSPRNKYNRQQHMVRDNRSSGQDRMLVKFDGPQSQNINNQQQTTGKLSNNNNNNHRQMYDDDNGSRDGNIDQNSSRSQQSNNNNNTNACMVLCFFHEMQMTNREGFPDKYKMLHVMTGNLRDMQLKDFYTDTIQECHHILEMEQTRDKCAFARHLVTCLSERARANCEDFRNTMLF